MDCKSHGMDGNREGNEDGRLQCASIKVLQTARRRIHDNTGAECQICHKIFKNEVELYHHKAHCQVKWLKWTQTPVAPSNQSSGKSNDDVFFQTVNIKPDPENLDVGDFFEEEKASQLEKQDPLYQAVDIKSEPREDVRQKDENIEDQLINMANNRQKVNVKEEFKQEENFEQDSESNLEIA